MEKLGYRPKVIRHRKPWRQDMPNAFVNVSRWGPQRWVWPILFLALAACARHDRHARGAAQYQASRAAEYHERYHSPLLSPGTQFASLPPAVQHTIRAEAGAAEIADIVKDNYAGRVLYRIYFRNPKVDPTLYVAPDGTLLNPDLTVAVGAAQDTVGVLTGGPVTGITLNDLPPQVVKTIQIRAPDAEVSYINKETHGDKVDYLIVFKDQMHPSLRIAPDGTVAPLALPAPK